ncbi:MAG: AAA family ATPase [bacterium]|nr:AAA family ATPase [bacterium]
MLIIVCGLSGTGKTTVARLLAERMSAAHLRTDVIRKEVFANPDYSEAEKERVYELMFERVEQLLKNGPVVLDATFLKKQHRWTAEGLARAAGVQFYVIEAVCPEEIVKDRLAKRAGDASDARFSEYLAQKKVLEPIQEIHLLVDTSKDLEGQIKNYPFIG